MKLLLDTNILIPLEPAQETAALNTGLAKRLSRLVHEGGHSLYVHPDYRVDIARDRDARRADRFRALVEKYPLLPDPPPIPNSFCALIGEADVGSNDWVDHRLLAAVYADAVHFLVSEDTGLHANARKLGLANRVLPLAEAVALLDRAPLVPLPPVRAVAAHALDPDDPIFASFRSDYPGFDSWLRTCRLEHRLSWRIDAADGRLAGFCIIKDEPASFDDLGLRPTKLCSFKVDAAHYGRKFGELLLRAVLERCHAERRTGIYVTVFPKYAPLVDLLLDFGFSVRRGQSGAGELILDKRLIPGQSELTRGLEFHVKFGPPRFDVNAQWHLVPIRPEYSDALFPETARNRVLFEGQHSFGNAVRKAYLCHSSIRKLQSGDVLAFYRTSEAQGLIAIGIVEKTLVSQEVGDIATMVAKRTVYSLTEIQDLCQKPVLVILFRQALAVKPFRTVDELIDGGVFRRPPQSIMTVRQKGVQWLRSQFAG